jgi:ribose/xylose/arabinose/galactoside ABC-type transport system permease subunit
MADEMKEKAPDSPKPSSAASAPSHLATWSLRRLPAVSGPALGLAAVLTMFVLLFSARGGLERFLSLSNLQVLVKDDTITAVAALGMLLVIVSGGIDLSVGSVMALVTVVTMQVYRLAYSGPDAVLPEGMLEALRRAGLVWEGTRSPAVASLAAVPAGLATGGLCGLCNGLAVTRLRLAPFVATLGMLSIARGLAVWLAGRTTINFPEGGRPGWVTAFSQVESEHTFFNPGFWLMLLLAGAVAVLLRYTVLGRYAYAIGSNEATARLCGVPVERSKVLIYTLAGLLTGLAGLLSFAHVGSGNPSGNVGRELTVIAAVVIGGASLSGGQGTVLGTLLGVLILAVLENGVRNFKVPVEVQYILIGAIILANTALSQWQRRQSE